MFEDRINFKGDLKQILLEICKIYNLGDFKTYEIVKVGYEDLNIILTTNTNKVFVKIFAKFRTFEDIVRYVDLIKKAIEAGVNHPKLLSGSQGNYTHLNIDSTDIYFAIMEYIDEKNLYESNVELTIEDKKSIIRQAAILNQLKINLPFIYDSWAVVNLPKEFDLIKKELDKEDLKLLEPVVKKFKIIDLEKLPKTFVHGDIIKTNLIKKGNKIYILDLSVSNIYPRIQELAVILCNVLFNSKDPEENKYNYNLALSEYQKSIKLTDYEIESLPIYLKAAHAMHIIGAKGFIQKEGYSTKENDYWLDQGRAGLKIDI